MKNSMKKTKNSFFNFFDFLIGKKILFKGETSYNGELVVLQNIFGKNLLASGLSQSGGMIESLWKTACSKINRQEVKNVLILGLGAGSCIVPITKRWPKAKITGVEIDPTMTELGKRFFGLSDKNLQIEIGDANEFIAKTKNTYDLILIDLFSGHNYPHFLEEQYFLENIKKRVEKNGILIFNRLYFADYKKFSDKFLLKLKKYFVYVRQFRFPYFFPTNLLIFCHN